MCSLVPLRDNSHPALELHGFSLLLPWHACSMYLLTSCGVKRPHAGSHWCEFVYARYHWCDFVYVGYHWCDFVYAGYHWCDFVYAGSHWRFISPAAAWASPRRCWPSCWAAR
jgi:hypothetical protein